MKIDSIPLWDDRTDVRLTCFLHTPDAFVPLASKRPALLICPGGGYLSCSRHSNEGDPMAMAFAIEGYQCFILEYSVSRVAPPGKARFPAQLLDLGKAVLTIKAHAEDWDLDPDRISILGFSAGANLCGMYACGAQLPLLQKAFGVQDEKSFSILSSLLIYGLLDYREHEKYRKSIAPTLIPKDHNVGTFGTTDPSLEEQEAFSPVCHVTAANPPTFIAAAVNDRITPSIQSLEMAMALHKAGVPYELHMFELGDHGFALGRYMFDEYRSDRAHACSKWVDLAKTFLLHHNAPETTRWEENPFTAAPPV